MFVFILDYGSSLALESGAAKFFKLLSLAFFFFFLKFENNDLIAPTVKGFFFLTFTDPWYASVGEGRCH